MSQTTTDPMIIELRLSSQSDPTVIETFITTDPSAAEDKKREWRDDSWNRYLTIEAREWQNDEVINSYAEVIY